MTSKTYIISKTNEQYIYVLLTVFLWIGALVAGYFFEVAFLLLNAFLFMGLAFYVWRYREQPLRVNLWHGILMGFIGLYWGSCLYAVNPEAAILEASRFTSILPLALFISSISRANAERFLRQ